ncbi:MAG: lipid-A-disaccharide synthase [Verrucomicrobiae bacterium]|nr:lipid-A-disaccharide synthase [Verrucomicrobiae bacterium]
MVKDRPPRIFAVAGEPSGDALGAAILRSVRERLPEVEIYGGGGQRLRTVGQLQCVDPVAHAAMGITAVAAKLPKFLQFRKILLQEVERVRPDLLLLVDFSTFNRSLAYAVKKRFPTIKTVFFIAPMFWAWGPWRAKKFERHIDLLISIYDFERDWFRRHTPNLRVECVGHPMIDDLARLTPVPREANTLALFPGSRESEIRRNLPMMLEAAHRVIQASTIDRVLVSATHKGAFDIIQEIFRQMNTRIQTQPFEIVTGRAHEIMQRSAAGLVKSGTVATECAAAGLPFVLMYRTGFIDYFIKRFFITTPFYGMPNLLAGRELIREFMPLEVTAPKLAQEVLELLNNRKKYNAVISGLDEVRSRLGPPGASTRAAELIVKMLESL